jgi:hypothetical protein
MNDKLLQAINLANMIAIISKSMELNPLKSPKEIQCIGAWAMGVVDMLEECAGEKFPGKVRYNFKDLMSEKIWEMIDHIREIETEDDYAHKDSALGIASGLAGLFGDEVKK